MATGTAPLNNPEREVFVQAASLLSNDVKRFANSLHGNLNGKRLAQAETDAKELASAVISLRRMILAARLKAERR